MCATPSGFTLRMVGNPTCWPSIQRRCWLTALPLFLSSCAHFDHTPVSNLPNSLLQSLPSLPTHGYVRRSTFCGYEYHRPHAATPAADIGRLLGSADHQSAPFLLATPNDGVCHPPSADSSHELVPCMLDILVMGTIPCHYGCR